MEADPFHSSACRKRKMDGGSPEWPCKLSKSNLWKPNPEMVDESAKPLRFFHINKGKWTAYTNEINDADSTDMFARPSAS
ncbi:hypothetical protein KP509_07G027100 [Ceratopteris richardii]|uniref:Uncharacterized protein n=1 Tax=Ceratopteris richardii TaxID=49495 RepID=A0A8T2UDD7_CERRI|nr:hypothetical protein KP509_07G027100 [Ceratopteris richardii]